MFLVITSFQKWCGDAFFLIFFIFFSSSGVSNVYGTNKHINSQSSINISIVFKWNSSNHLLLCIRRAIVLIAIELIAYKQIIEPFSLKSNDCN